MTDFSIFKRWQVWLTITVSLIVILGLTWFVTGSSGFPAAFPSALVAWGTLMLAIATIMIVISSRTQESQRRKDELAKEKRARNERLLKEIIEWANNVFKGGALEDMMVLQRDIKTAKDSAAINIEEWKDFSKEMPGKNQYIRAISLNFEQGLQTAVKQLIGDLETYLRELTTVRPHGQAQILIAKSKLKVYKSANSVIKEAANRIGEQTG